MTTAVLDELRRAPGALLVDRLNEGLPAGVFAALARRLALSTKTLAGALGINERTLRTRTRRLTGDG